MRDGQSAPIDERAKDSSVYQMWKHGNHPVPIKIEQLRIGRVFGSHHKFPLLAPGHADRDIEGSVGEDHARDIGLHQPPDHGGIGGVSADEEMGPKQEQIAYPSDGNRAG
jgi:hypothetical protein